MPATLQSTHETGPVLVGPCLLQGTIYATLRQLTRAFGQPQHLNEAQVSNDWHLLFTDGTVATIYDWRNAPADPDEGYAWRIGGKDRHAVHLVHAHFRRALGLGQERAA